MKNRMIRIIRTLGEAAALSLLLAVPVFADGTDTGAIQQTGGFGEAYGIRAVASVVAWPTSEARERNRIGARGNPAVGSHGRRSRKKENPGHGFLQAALKAT